jgi:acyl-CoA thioesterase FadM
MANHVYVAYLSEARARFIREIDPDARLFRPSVVADVHVKYLSSLQPRGDLSRRRRGGAHRHVERDVRVSRPR